MMCQPKATTSATAPLAVVAVVVICAAISSAAAVITGALLAILAVLGVVAAAGVATVAVLICRSQSGLWRPAPSRRVAAAPGLPAPRRVIALPAVQPLAIEAAPASRARQLFLAGGVPQPARQDELASVG
jgi:hypothetical protein